jgi:hypothetical protein
MLDGHTADPLRRLDVRRFRRNALGKRKAPGMKSRAILIEARPKGRVNCSANSRQGHAEWHFLRQAILWANPGGQFVEGVCLCGCVMQRFNIITSEGIGKSDSLHFGMVQRELLEGKRAGEGG